MPPIQERSAYPGISDAIPYELGSILVRANNAKTAFSQVLCSYDANASYGEAQVRGDLQARGDSIASWMRSLKNEIENLIREHSFAQKSLDKSMSKYRKIQEMIRVNESCSKYRSSDRCGQSEDLLYESLCKEAYLLKSASEDAMRDIMGITNVLGRVEACHTDLREEMKRRLAAQEHVIACQQTKLPSSRCYRPAESCGPPCSDTERQWEDNFRATIMKSMAMRHFARDTCVNTEDTLDKYAANIRSAWAKTTQILKEEIMVDQRALDVVQKTLGVLDKEVQECRFRLNLLKDERDKQISHSELHSGRMKHLCQRQSRDNLRDRPYLSLERELNGIQDCKMNIGLNLENDEQLLGDLIHFKQEQSEKMERLTRRLFSNRESLLPMRGTVNVNVLSSK